jgi:uncharacterized protein DUF6894
MLFFHLRLKRGSDALPDDEEPEQFADIGAARDAAVESLRELAAGAIREGRSFSYTGIDITDLEGKLLTQVHASDAVPQLKSH